MSPPDANASDWVEWSVASRPKGGEATSGDLHFVRPFAGGVLFAAIDGLGHGPEATEAARAAVAVLEQSPHEFVIPLVKRCHDALIKTRGAAMTVVSLNVHDNNVTWLGVGNVEGRLFHRNGEMLPSCESVLLRSGLIGFHLPPLYASVEPISPGDLLILATDGIQASFDTENYAGRSPAQITERILKHYFKGTDDGLALVVRYNGARHAA